MVEIYENLSNNFDNKVYKWMKIYYSGRVSIDSSIINDILNDLNKVNSKKKNDRFNNIKYQLYIEHINDTYKNKYLCNLQPEPHTDLIEVSNCDTQDKLQVYDAHELYKKLYYYFDMDLYEWMRVYYCDICSWGDVIINKILKEMKHAYLDGLIYISQSKYFDNNYTYYISHILGTFFDDYVSEKDPDPYWAD